MAKEKILVIQTAFIGDVVLATGIVDKLHRHFPSADIDMMVRKGNEGLLKDHPFLHEVLVWDKKTGKIKNLFKMLRKIRATGYDKIFNVQRFLATGILTAFSGAKYTVGYDKNPLSRLFSKRVKHVISDVHAPVHEIERCNDLISDLTGKVPEKPHLYPSVHDEEAVLPYKKKKYITISPASVWFTKQYPAEKWISFINKVPNDLSIYLLGGPPDKELAASICTAVQHPLVVNLSGQLSFLQSAALMRDAFMNYVNDSAPMHFASSVNAPVTAVYCSTLPSFGFGPLSDTKFIVEVPEKLPCRPCGLHGRKACPLGHFKCALDIQDEQLLNSLRA